MSNTPLAAIYIEIGSAALNAGRFSEAGNHFERALDFDIDAVDVLTPAQTRRASAGVAEARRHAGLIIVSPKPRDAAISIDGKPIEFRRWAYTIFVEPGDHYIRASLPGYADAVQSTTVEKGKTAIVTMALSQSQSAPAPPPVVHVHVVPVAVPAVSESDTPVPAAPLFRGLETMSAGLSVTPLIGFGVTPGTSVGGSVEATYRNGAFSANAEVRIVGSQVIERDDGIRTVRGGSNLSACGHVNIAFFCGLAGWSMIHVTEGKFAKIVDTEEPTSGLFGLRTGAEWRFTERLALRAFGELSLTMGEPSVWINHERYWVAPPVAGIFGIGMVAPFTDRKAEARPTNIVARAGY